MSPTSQTKDVKTFMNETNILCPVTLEFDGWPWKTIGHRFHAISSFANHTISIAEFKLEFQSGSAHIFSTCVFFICFDLCDLDLWFLTLTFCMDINFVNGNNSWIFHYYKMSGTLWKSVTDGRTDRQTDGRTDGRTDRRTYGRTEVYLELLGRSLKQYL